MKTVKLFNFGRILNGHRAIRIKKNDFDEFEVEMVKADGAVSSDDTYFTDDKEDAIHTAVAMHEALLKSQKRIDHDLRGQMAAMGEFAYDENLNS